LLGLSVAAAAMFSLSSAVPVAKQAVVVELFYSGVWNDHTSDVLTRDGIDITQGSGDEVAQAPPCTASLTFKGHDLNPRNPASPLFGLVGQNTPLRITVGTHKRFEGEIAELKPKLSKDGFDTWVEVTAAGISRRLGQGTDPLRDAIERFVRDNNPRGFWPLHDLEGSTQGRAAVGGRPLIAADQIDSAQFGKGQLVPWLAPGMLTGLTDGGTIVAKISPPGGGWALDVLFRGPDPASWGDAEPQFFYIQGIDEFPIAYRALIAPDVDDLEVTVVNGGSLGGGTVSLGSLLDGQPHHIRMEVVEASGNNVTVRVYVDGVLRVTDLVDIGVAAAPALTSVRIGWFSFDQWTLPAAASDLVLWGSSPPSIGDTFTAYSGHAGERGGNRISRLCTEEGVAVSFTGSAGNTVPLGAQYPEKFLDLLREAATADGGMLVDLPTGRSLHYRTGRSLYNQLASMSPNYAADEVAPPLEPVVDDQHVRNDVTVTRRDGGSDSAVKATGALSTAAVGRFVHAPTVNVWADSVLGDQAGWRLWLGTVDVTRFPRLSFDLVANPTLINAVAATDLGDRIFATSLPATLTPDPVDLVVRGWTERIGSHTRTITYNCTPTAPYRIGEVEHIDLSILVSAAASTAEILDTTETGVDINAGGGADWTYEDDFDVMIGGEKMTVTAVSAMAGTFPNRTCTLTVTRSVNGIVKTHPNGTAVSFFHQPHIGL
jgi:hypothetical protein